MIHTCKFCRSSFEGRNGTGINCSDFCSFLANIEVVSSGCWQWRGCLSNPAKVSGGYGYVNSKGRSTGAHLYSYRFFKGPVPPGLDVDHLCRNRGCVNPDHLEAVTHRENVLRGCGLPALRARQTHCHKGHEFTPDNIYFEKQGCSRRCRLCNKEKERLRWIEIKRKRALACL